MGTLGNDINTRRRFGDAWHGAGPDHVPDPDRRDRLFVPAAIAVLVVAVGIVAGITTTTAVAVAGLGDDIRDLKALQNETRAICSGAAR